MKSFVTAQNVEEEYIAKREEVVPVPEVQEWELEATEADEEEGAPVITTITVKYKQNGKPSKNDLHEIFNKLGVRTKLPKNPNKLIIFDAILDSSHPSVTKINNNTFSY